MRRGLTLAAGAALAAVGMLVSTSAARAATTITWNWTAGFLPALPDSATPPPGAENVSDGHRSTCDWKDSPTGRPLILVHGTWEHQRDNFMALSPFFTNSGLCVYTFNYGGNPGDVFWGYKSIAANAGELATYVDRVLASTGATQVDLVGHSQGGMMPRYYVKYLGGMPKVHTFVGLASGNNGTTLSGLVDLGRTIGVLPAVGAGRPAAPAPPTHHPGAADERRPDRHPVHELVPARRTRRAGGEQHPGQRPVLAGTLRAPGHDLQPQRRAAGAEGTGPVRDEERLRAVVALPRRLKHVQPEPVASAGLATPIGSPVSPGKTWSNELAPQRFCRISPSTSR